MGFQRREGRNESLKLDFGEYLMRNKRKKQ